MYKFTQLLQQQKTIFLVVIVCLVVLLVKNFMDNTKFKSRLSELFNTDDKRLMTENLSSADKSWLEEQAKRQEGIRKTCAKYGNEAIRPIRYNKLMFGEKLLYCHIQKVGCTVWMTTTFSKIVGTNNRWDVIHASEVKRSQSPVIFAQMIPSSNLTLAPLEENQNSIVSFAAVRHPFERLVSAYMDRVLHLKEKQFGDIDFKRFIDDHVIRKYASCEAMFGWCMDEHVKPYNTACSFCTIPYTILGRIETFDQDRAQILRKAGYEEERKKHLILNSNKQHVKANPEQRSTREWTEHYFKQLTLNETESLRKIFALDFEMFAYDPYLYG